MVYTTQWGIQLCSVEQHCPLISMSQLMLTPKLCSTTIESGLIIWQAVMYMVLEKKNMVYLLIKPYLAIALKKIKSYAPLRMPRHYLH